MERKNVWKSYDQKQLKEINKLAESYKDFISKAKTERLCVDYAIAEAKESGAIDLANAIKSGTPLNPGDKFYIHHMNKLLVMGIVGKEPFEKGMNILGAHIDSPRMDIKQNPLYESDDFAFLDTHYYGGIKKYQWVTLPLAIYGVIAKKDGKVVNVAIGDEHDDPVFCVTDLLIHLAGNQMGKKANVVIEGEALDILIGSQPLVKEGSKGKDIKEAVKANVLEILKKKYKIEEEDFLSAELEVVPAGCARDLGFDRSMIMAYGHDDRVCAYASYKALLDIKSPNRTSICLLTDKEEIGSVGATGMESRFFEDVIVELMELQGEYSEIAVRRCMRNSCVLSSDVSAGFDPSYPGVFEKKNSAFLGRGICFNKFTGRGGKGGSNDANAEYIGKLRQILDKAKIGWQTAELGKVDEGGGGTIAYILANYGMNVIDSGVAVLCMHSPFEIASKADIYEAYRCYKVFLQEMQM
ncbi:MAG: aminopeptidase [Firmicutes bacterium]|nr:aminopeptidase [Bacillota bacterium]